MSFFLSRSEQRFNRNLTSNRDPDATWIEERSGCHGNAPFRLANGARERKKKLSQKFFLFLPFNRSGCRVAPRVENDETRVEHDAKRHRRRRSAYRFPLVSSATRNSVDPPKKYQRKKKKKSRRPVSFCHGKQKPNTTNSAGLGNFTTPLRWDPRQRKKKAIRRNTEALTNTHTLTQRDLLRTPIAHRRQSGAAGWKSKPSGPLLPPSTVNHLPSPNNNDNSSNNNSSNNRAHIRRAPNGRPMGGGWWVVAGGWWVAGGGRGGGGGGLEAYH